MRTAAVQSRALIVAIIDGKVPARQAQHRHLEAAGPQRLRQGVHRIRRVGQPMHQQRLALRLRRRQPEAAIEGRPIGQPLQPAAGVEAAVAERVVGVAAAGPGVGLGAQFREEPVFQLLVAGEVQVLVPVGIELLAQPLGMPGLQRGQGAHRIEGEAQRQGQGQHEQRAEATQHQPQQAWQRPGHQRATKIAKLRSASVQACACP